MGKVVTGNGLSGLEARRQQASKDKRRTNAGDACGPSETIEQLA